MKTESFVLDSSALLTLIESEPGADYVEELLRKKHCIIPWLCLMEVQYISIQEHGESLAFNRYAALKSLPVKILWEIDEATLLKAASFKSAYRVSFADSIIAAFAYSQEAVLVHKDLEFEQLASEIRIYNLPYKK